MWSIVQVQFMPKMILNFRDRFDRLDRLLIVMKIRYDNYMTDCIDAIYAAYKTKLSSPIWPSSDCDKNQTG